MNITKFVQNVKFWCERKGVRPTVACRESGAGERLLENVKRGSEPSVGKVELLAHYLGTTVSELLGETAPEAGELPADARAMAEAYAAADEDARLIVDTALKPYRK